jgi:predicted MFS family arabinose efflux permease
MSVRDTDRSLVWLVCCVAAVETAFFTVLTPLLATLVSHAHASHTAAGILVAAYPAGALVGAIPAGLLVGKIGARNVILIGLLLLSVGTLGFGLTNSLGGLEAARFIQGVGGAAAWTAGLAWLSSTTSPERRGQAIGLVMGAALVGALIGPALGAAAALGRVWVFSTFSVCALILGWWTFGLHETPRKEAAASPLGDFLRHPDIVAGLWLVFLAGFFYGVLIVLAPLKLRAVGWSPTVIGGIFLLAAAIEALLNPMLGKWFDRGGGRPLIRATLLGSAAVAFVLPVLTGKWLLAVGVVVAAIVFGAFWLPGTVVLSHGVEDANLEPGTGYALWNIAWAPATVIGAVLAGWLSDVSGYGAPYVLVGCVSLITLTAVSRQRVLVGT